MRPRQRVILADVDRFDPNLDRPAPVHPAGGGRQHAIQTAVLVNQTDLLFAGFHHLKMALDLLGIGLQQHIQPGMFKLGYRQVVPLHLVAILRIEPTVNARFQNGGQPAILEMQPTLVLGNDNSLVTQHIAVLLVYENVFSSCSAVSGGASVACCIRPRFRSATAEHQKTVIQYSSC